MMLLFLWCLLGAAGPDSSGFFIESITVEGNRLVSREIVVGQTRLVEGKVYGESELRRAVIRVRQLPFVRHASFRLERGSERGRYCLVVRLEEMAPFFFDGQYTRGWTEDGSDFESYNYSGGPRYFIGKRGLIYGSTFPLTDRYAAGYSHFDILGKGLFFNLELSLTESDRLERTRTITKIEPRIGRSFTLAAPLARNQWIKLIYDRDRLERETLFQLPPSPILPDGELRNLGVTTTESWDLSWEYNTANDTFLPTLGATLRVGLFREDQTTVVTDFFEIPEVDGHRNDSEQWYLDAEKAISPRFRHTFSGRLHLDYRELDQDGGTLSKGTTERTELGLGYRFRPLTGLKAHRFGDVYLGGSLNWIRTDLESKLFFRGSLDSVLHMRLDRYQIEAFAAWRHRWGLIRANLRYIHADVEDRVGAVRQVLSAHAGLGWINCVVWYESRIV